MSKVERFGDSTFFGATLLALEASGGRSVVTVLFAAVVTRPLSTYMFC